MIGSTWSHLRPNNTLQPDAAGVARNLVAILALVSYRYSSRFTHPPAAPVKAPVGPLQMSLFEQAVLRVKLNICAPLYFPDSESVNRALRGLIDLLPKQKAS